MPSCENRLINCFLIMLFDIVNANIDKLVIHKIGSRTENTENVYSKKCMDLEEDSPVQMLKQYFLSSFR